MENNCLLFFIKNSIPEVAENGIHKGNIGIRNVTKRLELIYPGLHDLQVISGQGSHQVILKIQLNGKNVSVGKNKSEQVYTHELA